MNETKKYDVTMSSQISGARADKTARICRSEIDAEGTLYDLIRPPPPPPHPLQVWNLVTFASHQRPSHPPQIRLPSWLP
jgi:hypothetical protein